MAKSNCLIYAWRMWRYCNKDSLLIRESNFGWFPHFSVLIELHDGTIVKKEFVPIEPRTRWLPPLFFDGVEKTTIYRPIKDALPMVGL
jgi:hypothetical protein